MKKKTVTSSSIFSKKYCLVLFHCVIWSVLTLAFLAFSEQKSYMLRKEALGPKEEYESKEELKLLLKRENISFKKILIANRFAGIRTSPEGWTENVFAMIDQGQCPESRLTGNRNNPTVHIFTPLI